MFLSRQRATDESSVAQTASEHKGLTPAALRVSAVSVSGLEGRFKVSEGLAEQTAPPPPNPDLPSAPQHRVDRHG